MPKPYYQTLLDIIETDPKLSASDRYARLCGCGKVAYAGHCCPDCAEGHLGELIDNAALIRDYRERMLEAQLLRTQIEREIRQRLQ